MIPRISLICVRRYCAGPPSKSPRPWYLAPLDQFERWLQDKYPKAYKMQRTVVDGGKHCFGDLKMYARVWSAMRQGKQLSEFSRKELEVYVLTPTDIEKLAAIAVVVALPMTIFILAFALVFFPRLLLTRHFWTLEQTESFRSIILDKRRRFHYGHIANTLLAELEKLDEGKRNQLIADFAQALKTPPVTLGQLESKYASLIQRVNIDSLPKTDLFHLCRAHGLLSWGSQGGARLQKHARIVAELDSKLRNEEDIDSMSLPDLKQSLYIRQFDVLHLTDDQERQLLKDWLSLTRHNPSAPVTLHAPILAQLQAQKEPQPQ